MSKYTLIVSELKTVNEARFQLICNHYLAQEHNNGEVKSPGTVVGKEKTRKGKPDAYIRFDDGSYLLAEYTTKEKDENPVAFFKKLEGDLWDCLNFEALHIKPEQVRQIVLCCNSAMTLAEEEYLHEIAKPYSLRIVDVHALSIFLQLKGKTIAREFLDIPFDTNQLLTKNEFLNQYHKRNLSTRLDTVLVGRQTEQAEIITAITSQEITIVKGPAGVGKSRLVLAAIDVFCKEYPDFEPMYVQSKNESITEDLVYNLDSDKSYLLFLDDANRQMDNLLKIIYKQAEFSAENIKVVLTVRDYAFEEIRRKLSELRFATLEIRKLSDEVIREILFKNNYVFEDTVLLNRIVSISKGNPRLALMAAIFSVERTDLNLLADVSTIYDAYFQTIIQDKEVFRDPTTLKVLGILSYFYALDLETTDAKKILQSFDIAYDVFIETANLLYDLELVDIYQTYTVKITEQVLATYFFYKVFIKERLLSFESLLQSFFSRYTHRMKDSFYPAVNSFGPANTVVPLKETLLRFYETAKKDHREESLFLGVFGPYLPLQVFAAVQKAIAQLPDSTQSKETKSATLTSLQFYPPLQFLEPFYGSKEPFELTMAMQLTIEYVTKRPGLYPTTQKALLEKLRTTEEDFPSCERQRIAFEWLRQQADPLARKYFLSLFSEILLTIFFPDEAYYKNDDDWDLHGSIKELRGSFWQEVRHSIHEHEESCFPILWEYLKEISRSNALLLHFDSPFLKAIIEELNSSCFEDALFVHRYVEAIQVRGIHLDWHKKARQQFNNAQYRVFTVLSFEREESIAFRKIYYNYDKFNVYKTKKISKALPVSTLRAFKKIYPSLQEIYGFSQRNRYQVNPEIDLLVAGVISTDPEEGIKVLRYYFKQGNLRPLNPVIIYKQALTAGVEWVHRIYQLAKATNFPHQQDWMEFYFAILPEKDCTKAKLNQLLSFYQSTDNPLCWKNIVLAKFIGIEPGLPTILLRVLTAKRNADPTFKYDLGYEFFIQYPQVIEKDFEVSKQAYFQHMDMEGDHDYEKKEFALFFKKDPKFLLDYIQEKNKSKGDLNDRSFTGLEKIWDMGDVRSVVYEALLYLINLKTYYSSDHVGLIFFHNLKEPYVSEAVALLKKMIDDFPGDKRVIDTALDIGRNAFPKHYHELIVHYLTRNPDFELFKKIHFYNNHFSSSGNVSWDEFKANILRGISASIQQMPKAYQYTEHLAFLDQNIVAYIKNSEEERKRWFMGMS